MRRFIPSLLPAVCLAVLFSNVAAQQTQFDHANDLMNDNRIEEAVEEYRSIEKKGYKSGKLYYNLGLASMYQDSLGLAKYYLLQATTYPDSRTEAERALDFVNQQFEQRSAVLPMLPWDRFFHWLQATFGTVLLMVFAVLLFNLAVGSVIASWFTQKASKWLRYAGISTGILSLLLIASSVYLNYLEEQYQTAVMTDRQSSVHERPDSSSASVSTAYEGYVMTVDLNRSEPESDWYQVRLENGLNGWVSRQTVRTF